jgi:hypothetical protein
MHWLTIDPSNHTGLAFWNDETLMATYTARAIGTKGKWISTDQKGEKITYPSKWDLFKSAFEYISFIAMEEGFGMRPNAIKSQSEYRGFFKAIIEFHNHENGKAIKCQVVNVSEWRRAIKEEFGLSWPATTERKKALAISTVQKAYGITVSDDEADAVLLGRACIRMGMINESKEVEK